MNELKILNGMGPKTIELFHKLNIENIEDLITYYPKKYNVIKRTDMKNILEGDKVIIDGVVDCQPTMLTIGKSLKKIIFRLTTNQSIYNICAFNQQYLVNELKPGIPITIIGKYDKRRNTINLTEVRKGLLPKKVTIEPIYRTTEDLNRKTIAKFIDLALNSNLTISDNIPNYYIEKYKFQEKIKSIYKIHHPSDIISYRKALQRLKYEEFYLYLSKIQQLKQKRTEEENAIKKEFDRKKVDKLIKTLPFSLTEDQIKTVNEIEKDMKQKIRMNRLVQGDVGSGKTIVAFIASYMNYLAGYQTALMVPTEILATQHYQNAIDLLAKFDMKIELLTSNITKKNKEKIYKKIENKEIDFIIGTQSLIQEKLKYANLGLIITDEQHRFGVHQREELRNKGVFPDVLSMSATPIPRTYALTIYGDMDVSSIKTKPKGRKEVITYLKKEKEITDVLTLMKKEIDNKHQIYVIVPQVEGNETNDLNNVDTLTEKMNLAFGKIAKIGVVHGKLIPEEKQKVMESFEKGKIDILISTTVIEVGVNVPNASTIVIFQANYFGLSTLHQLRGRVGRGDIQSYCILIAKEEQERLKMLETCTDGFEISEYDFKTRGEGDLFGSRQSGDANFKLANIRRDFELLVRVKQDVDEYTIKKEISL